MAERVQALKLQVVEALGARLSDRDAARPPI